ncbi:MAG: hypothetical protein E7393_04140 [Ruminococcaceae bacterium]|nr:hypothetical protein [Oscillospiraceae bacterium]
MVEQDTVRLLRECDAGVAMGVSSIEDVLPHVQDAELKKRLKNCQDDHEELKNKLCTLLDAYHDAGKNPNPMAKSMSWVKTTTKLMLEDSDATVADLMTDGCNMGVKSLSRYLNQYKAADEKSKNITKELIGLEEQLAIDLRQYL